MSMSIGFVSRALLMALFSCFFTISYAADYIVMQLPKSIDKDSVKTKQTDTRRTVLYKSKRSAQSPWQEQININVFHPKLKLSAQKAMTMVAERFVHYCPDALVYPLHLYQEQDYPMAMIGILCLKTKQGTRGEIVMAKAMQTEGGTFVLIVGHHAPLITPENADKLNKTFITPVFRKLRAFLDTTFICRQGMTTKQCLPGNKVSVKHLRKIKLHLGIKAL